MGTEAIASFLGGTNYPSGSARTAELDFGLPPMRPRFAGPRCEGTQGPDVEDSGTVTLTPSS